MNSENDGNGLNNNRLGIIYFLIMFWPEYIIKTSVIVKCRFIFDNISHQFGNRLIFSFFLIFCFIGASNTR